jgi:tRNA(Ile)-lysidine synthase
LDPARPVVAGVSGGPDSLCLLDVLRQAGYTVVAAHFNHHLRPEAGQEAEDVAGLAGEWGLDFVTDSADVHAYANEHSLSIEEAARLLRYRFLFETARSTSAQAVAVGHTADDQAETVLMHFLRGAGLAGLKGMEYRTILPVFDDSIPLVRPLLGLWRAETEAYCRDHGLTPHYDSTNTDETFFRNRLRHRLIPELETYNPRVKEALLRSAAALAGDYSILQEVLDERWKAVLLDHGEGWFAFDAAGVNACSPAMRRGLIRRAAETLRPDDRDFGFEALQRAADFAGSPEAKQVDFIHGLYLFREAGRVYLAAYEADLPSAQWPQLTAPCAIDERIKDLGNGWSLSIEVEPQNSEHWSLNTDPWSAWLDEDRIAGGLHLRSQQPGDRMQPLGMEKGSVKLSDLFVNAKVPQRARAAWPVVCAGYEIAWVPGVKAAQPFRVTEGTVRVIHMTLKKL